MKDIPDDLIAATLRLRDEPDLSGPNFGEGQINPNSPGLHSGVVTYSSYAQFFDAVQSATGKESVASITFGHGMGPVENEISLSDKDHPIASIQINRSGTFAFRNVRVSNIQVNAHNVTLILENCSVGRVYLYPGIQAKIKVKQSTLGMLRIDAGGCRALTIRGGHVLDLGLPPADGDNPFVGDVKISGVTFPVRSYKAQLATGQVYRNMQAHLADLKNFPLRDEFHAIEMALERNTNPWAFHSFVSFAYDLFARYGLSASRPLLWLFFLTAVSAILSGALGFGVCQLDQKFGWRQELEDGSFYCGFLLGMTPLTNPLGLFSKDPIAVAKTWYWAAWLTVQGFLSAILIALALLAIRRKFRTQE
jgi:hypothetical protein